MNVTTRRRLRQFAATTLFAISASAGLLWAAPKKGSVVTVRVMSAKLMKSPKFIGSAAGGVSRGDSLTVQAIKGDWYQVKGTAIAGWINRASVVDGKVALSSKPGSGGSGASRDEVELAGRGFTPDVEKEYRGKYPELDFSHVDDIEDVQIDSAVLEKFAKDGELGGAE